MITCPACQHQNVDGSQFCEMCGEELPSATAAPATTGNLVKCPQCDHENPADNLICEACGTELKAGAATPASSTATTTTTAPSTPTPAAPNVDTAPAVGALEGEEAAPASGSASMGASSTTAATTPVITAPTSPEDEPADTSADASMPVTTVLTSDSANAVDTSASATPAAPAANQNLAPGNVKFVVEQGQSVGAQFVLGDAEMLVGREDEDSDVYPDIDLSDQDAGYVHRRHATIKFENGSLTVTHLGGANKTRINNKPVADDTPTPINLGDKIGFGKVVVRLLPV